MNRLYFSSLLLLLLFFQVSFAANRFWVGNGGNWSSTAHWSATSGGAGGASVPTTSDNVFFDANSFSLAGQTVTIDVNASCSNMTWTNALNSPAIAGAAAFSLTMAGTSITLITAMSYTVSGTHQFTNAGNITMTLANASRTLGDVIFTGTSSRTVNINGNGAFVFGRMTVGNNTTINVNGTGTKTIDGFYTGTDVLTNFTGNLTFTDTVQTGYNNDFYTSATSVNTFQTVLVGEVDNGSRNHRFQGTNTFNGEVITANDYENTDRLHFYHSEFNDKVTITAPDGRAQFRNNAVFNDTLYLGANTSVRCFDTDTFNSVVICTDDVFLYLSQTNSGSEISVFNDSVYFGPDMEFIAYRDVIFNGPVNFAGNDVNGTTRRFNESGGTVTFNDLVWFNDDAGTSSSRWVFERQTDFNMDVVIGNNTFLHFTDGNGTSVFNGNLTVGNGNDIYFDHALACNGLSVFGNGNTILGDNTCDFDNVTFGDLNSLTFSRNVDFNDNAVFGDTNAIEFSELGGQIDVWASLTYGQANDITFYRSINFAPASPSDSMYLGYLSSAEFRLISANNYFENFILENESRATFRNGANRFNNIRINDFSTMELSAGGTNTVAGDFIANETCSSPPIVRSGTGGVRAVIDFTNVSPTWSNVIVQDLEVTSSNILTIDAAVNNGNLDSLDDSTPNPGPPVSGATIWITNDRAGTTLYWIGSSSSGAGVNWSNAANWSTSSGGAPSICIPTPKDNVVFDANSFNAAGEKVVIDASFVICNDMTWSGVTSGAILEGSLTNTIFMTGNLSLDANMNNNFFGKFEFNANDTSVRTIDPNGIDFEGAVTFNYEGGQWELADDLSCGGTLTISDGTVDATSSNYDLNVFNSGSDFILRHTGSFLGHDDSINVADELMLSDSAVIDLGTGEIVTGGDLTMTDFTIIDVSTGNLDFGSAAALSNDVQFTVDNGSLTVGNGFDISNNGVLDFDSVTIDVGNDWNMSNDVTLRMDSCNITVGGAMNFNNNASGVLGGSDLTVNGGDFYIQDDGWATMKNGSITVNGDQFYLDDNAVFTDTASVITANNDFYQDNSTQFSTFGGTVMVLSDDYFLDLDAVFSMTNGTLDVVGDDFYMDDNSRADFDNSAISVISNIVVENTSVLNLINGSVMNTEGTLDMNNTGTINANNAQIFINASFDLDAGCTFNEGTSTVTFDGDFDGSSIRTRTEDFYNLVINKLDSTDDVRVINNSFVVRNNLHILSGEFWDSNESTDGPYQISGNTTGTGSLIVTSEGTLRLGDIDGGSDAPTTFPTGWNTAAIFLDDSSTVYYRQRLAGVPQIVSSVPVYGNLTLDNSNGPLYERAADGAVQVEGIFFIDDNIQFADSGYQVVGNANAWTNFEMDNGSVLVLGSATTATTLPTFPARDWDSRSTVVYAAGVPQMVVSISGNSNVDSYGHLTLSNLDPTPSLTTKFLENIISVRRQLNINAYANLVDSGYQISGNNTGEDLTMAANAQLTIGTSAANTLFPSSYTNGNISCDVNSLVVYNSDLDQEVSNNPSYGNLQMSSSGTVIKSLTGNTDVNGSLIIDAQNSLTTTGNNYNMTIGGDWINNGSFSPNTGQVTFDGSSLSDISGSTQTGFYNLTINNSAADSAVRLLTRANVMNSLTLTNGIVVTGDGRELIIDDNATSSSGSNASHVDGPMMKVGNDAFDFPVGDLGKWARLGISNLQNGPATTDTIIAQYIRATHPEAFWNDTDYVGMTGGLENVSIVEYWNLERISGTVLPYVSLYWSDNTESYITDTADLTVAHYTGAQTWVNEGGVASGTLASGVVRTVSNITSYSPFTFGSTNSLVNPLPVELLSFEAKAEGNTVRLDWTTLSEINNDYFTIERSSDAKDFHPIGEVEGAGNSRVKKEYSTTDDFPLTGISYYRLKQTDFNGKYSYSDVRTVMINVVDRRHVLRVFPNPVQSGEHLYFSRLTAGDIIDMTGVVLFSVPVTNRVALPQLSSGTYFFRPKEGKPIPFTVH